MDGTGRKFAVLSYRHLPQRAFVCTDKPPLYFIAIGYCGLIGNAAFGGATGIAIIKAGYRHVMANPKAKFFAAGLAYKQIENHG